MTPLQSRNPFLSHIQAGERSEDEGREALPPVQGAIANIGEAATSFYPTFQSPQHNLFSPQNLRSLNNPKAAPSTIDEKRDPSAPTDIPVEPPKLDALISHSISSIPVQIPQEVSPSQPAAQEPPVSPKQEAVVPLPTRVETRYRVEKISEEKEKIRPKEPLVQVERPVENLQGKDHQPKLIVPKESEKNSPIPLAKQPTKLQSIQRPLPTPAAQKQPKQQPKLVIGKLTVEVIQQAAPKVSTVQPPPQPVKQVAKTTNGFKGHSYKLKYGLGQL